MGVVTSKCFPLCCETQSHYPLPSVCPQHWRRWTPPSAAFRRHGKVEAPSFPVPGNDEQFIWTGLHNLLYVQKHFYLPLKKLNNCWCSCFEVQLLERSQHNYSVFFPLSFSAVSIPIRIKLSEVAQCQTCTTKIHGRSLYKKPCTLKPDAQLFLFQEIYFCRW